MSRRMRVSMVAVAFVALCTGGVAADELGAKMEKFCAAIKPQLAERGQTSIAVGGFTPAAKLNASGGPAIANAMIEEFEKVGIKVDRDAPMEVTGRYSKVVEPANRLTVLRIKCQILDNGTGGEFASVDVNLFDPATIMRLAGGSGDISGASLRERSAKVNQNLDAPQARVAANTRIAAAGDSPYALEVLVGSGDDARPRAASVIKGNAFVSLGNDDVYAVRLINDSEHAAAVTLAIDGLSMFAFSENPQDRNSLVIVPAHGQETIRGWFRTTEESNEFLVAELAKAAVSKKVPPSSASIGTITATVAVAWPQGAAPPPGEEDGVVQKGDSATALGKKINRKYERVEFQFGRPKVVISVRYNKAVEPGNLPR
jgi:hypothetical protein